MKPIEVEFSPVGDAFARESGVSPDDYVVNIRFPTCGSCGGIVLIGLSDQAVCEVCERDGQEKLAAWNRLSAGEQTV